MFLKRMSKLGNYFSNFSLLQFIAGAISVAGVGAIAVGIAQANINRLNDEDANLAARIKALEDNPYSLPSSVTADISGNCVERATVGALTKPTNEATLVTAVSAMIDAALVNPC